MHKKTRIAFLGLGQVLALAAYGAELQPVNELEEIIVTAQKREQTLLEVPISVSAFTGDALERTGATELADFLQTAPGVSLIDSQSGSQEINIRGVSSLFGDSPVGYYLDEVSFSVLGNTGVVDVRTFDLERVEVLRGPQGTLYGDGSLGGVVRVLTRNPNLKEFEGKADLTGSQTTDSDDANWAAKAAVNLPLVEDKIALRVVGSTEQNQGWIDNPLTGERDFNDRDIDTARAKLRIAPSDRLDVVLGVWHYEEASTDGTSLDDRTSILGRARNETEYDIFNLTASYDFGSMSLVSATAVMDWSSDSVGTFAALPLINEQTQDLTQQELRLTSNAGDGFRWTTGVFFRKIERDLTAQITGFDFNQFSDSKAWAVFGEATWPLFTDRLEATLGLRYFEDERSRRDTPDLLGEVSSKFDSVSPRVNIAWRPSDAWMVYGNVSKGFRSGQIQPIVSIVTARALGIDVPIGVDAEELWSYEVGAKGSALDKRLTLEAAVYYNDWKDLQLTQVVDAASLLSAFRNAGSAGVLGAEFNATFRAMEGLTLQAGASINDAEYKDALPAANIQKGQRIASVPKTTWNASGTYEWPMTATLSGYARAGVQYTSERRDDSLGGFPSSDVTTVDVRIGADAERWGAFLFVDNLTDEDDPIAVTYPTAFGHSLRFRPRTVGLNVRVNF